MVSDASVKVFLTSRFNTFVRNLKVTLLPEKPCSNLFHAKLECIKNIMHVSMWSSKLKYYKVVWKKLRSRSSSLFVKRLEKVWMVFSRPLIGASKVTKQPEIFQNFRKRSGNMPGRFHLNLLASSLKLC